MNRPETRSEWQLSALRGEREWPKTFSISVKQQLGSGCRQHAPSKPGAAAVMGLRLSACRPASSGTGPAISIGGSRRVSSGLPTPPVTNVSPLLEEHRDARHKSSGERRRATECATSRRVATARSQRPRKERRHSDQPGRLARSVADSPSTRRLHEAEWHFQTGQEVRENNGAGGGI
jgi:hypothetical protein